MAKAKFSELVRLAQNEPQRVQVGGQPAGGFICEKDLALLLRLKQKKTENLIDKLVAAAAEEGVREESLTGRRGKIKKVQLD